MASASGSRMLLTCPDMTNSVLVFAYVVKSNRMNNDQEFTK